MTVARLTVRLSNSCYAITFKLESDRLSYPVQSTEMIGLVGTFDQRGIDNQKIANSDAIASNSPPMHLRRPRQPECGGTRFHGCASRYHIIKE